MSSSSSKAPAENSYYKQTTAERLSQRSLIEKYAKMEEWMTFSKALEPQLNKKTGKLSNLRVEQFRGIIPVKPVGDNKVANEAFLGGDTHIAMIFAAYVLYKELGNDIERYNGFNDMAHSGGRHKKGCACDIRLRNPSDHKAVAAKMSSILADLQKGIPNGFYVLDEYDEDKRSEGWTGGHIHVDLRDEKSTNALWGRMQYAENNIFSSPESKYMQQTAEPDFLNLEETDKTSLIKDVEDLEVNTLFTEIRTSLDTDIKNLDPQEKINQTNIQLGNNMAIGVLPVLEAWYKKDATKPFVEIAQLNVSEIINITGALDSLVMLNLYKIKEIQSSGTPYAEDTIGGSIQNGFESLLGKYQVIFDEVHKTEEYSSFALPTLTADQAQIGSRLAAGGIGGAGGITVAEMMGVESTSGKILAGLMGSVIGKTGYETYANQDGDGLIKNTQQEMVSLWDSTKKIGEHGVDFINAGESGPGKLLRTGAIVAGIWAGTKVFSSAWSGMKNMFSGESKATPSSNDGFLKNNAGMIAILSALGLGALFFGKDAWAKMKEIGDTAGAVANAGVDVRDGVTEGVNEVLDEILGNKTPSQNSNHWGSKPPESNKTDEDNERQEIGFEEYYNTRFTPTIKSWSALAQSPELLGKKGENITESLSFDAFKIYAESNEEARNLLLQNGVTFPIDWKNLAKTATKGVLYGIMGVLVYKFAHKTLGKLNNVFINLLISKKVIIGGGLYYILRQNMDIGEDTKKRAHEAVQNTKLLLSDSLLLPGVRDVIKKGGEEYDDLKMFLDIGDFHEISKIEKQEIIKTLTSLKNKVKQTSFRTNTYEHEYRKDTLHRISSFHQSLQRSDVKHLDRGAFEEILRVSGVLLKTDPQTTKTNNKYTTKLGDIETPQLSFSPYTLDTPLEEVPQEQAEYQIQRFENILHWIEQSPTFLAETSIEENKDAFNALFVNMTTNIKRHGYSWYTLAREEKFLSALEDYGVTIGWNGNDYTREIVLENIKGQTKTFLIPRANLAPDVFKKYKPFMNSGETGFSNATEMFDATIDDIEMASMLALIEDIIKNSPKDSVMYNLAIQQKNQHTQSGEIDAVKLMTEATLQGEYNLSLINGMWQLTTKAAYQLFLMPFQVLGEEILKGSDINTDRLIRESYLIPVGMVVGGATGFTVGGIKNVVAGNNFFVGQTKGTGLGVLKGGTAPLYYTGKLGWGSAKGVFRAGQIGLHPWEYAKIKGKNILSQGAGAVRPWQVLGNLNSSPERKAKSIIRKIERLRNNIGYWDGRAGMKNKISVWKKNLTSMEDSINQTSAYQNWKTPTDTNTQSSPRARTNNSYPQGNMGSNFAPPQNTSVPPQEGVSLFSQSLEEADQELVKFNKKIEAKKQKLKELQSRRTALSKTSELEKNAKAISGLQQEILDLSAEKTGLLKKYPHLDNTKPRNIASMTPNQELELKKTMDEAINNISESKSFTEQKKLKLRHSIEKGVEKIGLFAMVQSLTYIANAENPQAAALETVTFGGLYLGASRTGAASPFIIATLAVAQIVWGEEAIEAFSFATEWIETTAVDPIGLSEEWITGGDIASGGVNRFYAPFETIWNDTIDEIWKGDDAMEYFSDTIYYNEDLGNLPINLNGFAGWIPSGIKVMHRGGKADVKKWNDHITIEIKDINEEIESTQLKIERYKKQETIYKDQSTLYYINRHRTALEKKLPKLKNTKMNLEKQEIKIGSVWVSDMIKKIQDERNLLTIGIENETVGFYRSLQQYFKKIEILYNVGFFEQLGDEEISHTKNFLNTIISRKGDRLPSYLKLRSEFLFHKLFSQKEASIEVLPETQTT